MSDGTEWSGWPEDEPGFDEPDTTDLGDEGFGEAGFGEAGFGYDSELPGFDEPALGDAPDGAGESPFAPRPMGYGETFTEDPFGAGEPEAGLEAGGEPDGEAGFGPADDAPVGADPDLQGDDPAWHESAFPAPMDLGATPEPVDGFPWTDAAVLGDGGTGLPDPVAEAGGSPEAGELFAYAGEDVPAGGASWAALAMSPDPATSALARFWGGA